MLTAGIHISAERTRNRNGAARCFRGRRALCAWLLLSLCLCRPARAESDRCQADAGCRHLSDQALSLYRDQRYYDAWRLLRQAYARVPEPRLLVNLGRCLERLGLYQDAVAAYQKFLQDDPIRNPTEQARVQRYIEEAKATAPSSLQLAPVAQSASPVAAPEPAPEARDQAPREVEPSPQPTRSPARGPGEPPTDARPTENLAPKRLPGQPGMPPAPPAQCAVVQCLRSARPLSRNPLLWTGVGLAVSILTIGLVVGLAPGQPVPHYVVEW